MNLTQINTKTQKYRNVSFAVVFFLGVIEGLFAAIYLIQLPSDAPSGLLFHLSFNRLAILIAILLITISCFLSGFLSLTNSKFAQKIASFLVQGKPALMMLTGVVAAALCITGITILLDLYRSTGLFFYLAYAQRFSPLLIYLSTLSIQFSGLIAYKNHNNLTVFIKAEAAFLKTWLLVSGGLVILTILITTSRLGLDPDPIGWGKPTVPLLEWQIWLGILVCLLSRVFSQTRFFKYMSAFQTKHPLISGLVISLFIWGSATILWLGQPVPPGFFATPPRAPNFEIYPFSDAAFYDFHAQSMLIGLGFRGGSIPPRPMYILFLAFAHLIAGQNYTQVILVQTLVLALFPMIVFWIGKKLANQAVGIIAAFFIIFREWTSILSTPFTSDISNSKLMFADLPAALAISLLLLVVILWLEKPRQSVLALLAGGMLGISLLIRTQIIILLPVILIFFWITARKIKFTSLIFPTALFLFGFILAVTPWLSRSYRITGQLVFDHPESQTRVMAERYSPDTELSELDRMPDETIGEYNQRLNEFIKQQIFKNPWALVQFTAAHWFNSEISNVFIFPVRFSINNPRELLMSQHAFWEEWQGSLTTWQFIVLFINLSVLSAGVIFFFQNKSWEGLLPLVFNAVYHFSNAAARNSGWRYLLPADWIFLLYFAGGIYVLINLGKKRLSEETNKTELHSLPKSTEFAPIIAVAVLIVLIGYLPLYGEIAFPRRYPPATNATAQNYLAVGSSNLSISDKTGIERILQDPNVVVLNGRMLYPRFYGEKEGEEKTGKTGYTLLPFSRYVFLVAGEPDGTIIFPHSSPDLPFRNAETALVIGCTDGLAISARVVILLDNQSLPFITTSPVNWACSPSK